MAEPRDPASQKIIESFIEESLCYWIGNYKNVSYILSVLII